MPWGNRSAKPKATDDDTMPTDLKEKAEASFKKMSPEEHEAYWRRKNGLERSYAELEANRLARLEKLLQTQRQARLDRDAAARE
jgi:hypothetical protein